MSDPPRTLTGTIIAHRHDFIFAVKLETGELIEANVPRRIARLMWRIVPGDRVRISQTKTNPTRFLIVDHER